MELATPRVQQTGHNSYQVSHGDDQNLFVQFTMEAIKQEFESEKQGRPIFKDVPHIHILFPGDKSREIKRPVRLTQEEAGNAPPDPVRFPRQWAAFQNQQEQTHDGTPIEEWAPIGKAQAFELKALRIYTVEQLANVPDASLHAVGMGGRELRDKAISWLKNAEGGSEVSRLTAENSQLKADMEALKVQMAELAKSQKTLNLKGKSDGN